MRRPSRAAASLLAVAVVAALVAGGLLLGAPGAEAPEGAGAGGALPSGRSDVDLDTDALRGVRAKAGLPPCEPGPGEEPVEGGLPAVEVPCFGAAGSVDLSTLRGPMVVNLWASWCGPCREELPLYERFHQRFGDEVGVLGVDFQDQAPGNAGQLLLETGVSYAQLADPGGALNGAGSLPRIAGLPFVALINADGRVVHSEFVIIDSVQQLEDLVREHLGVRL